MSFQAMTWAIEQKCTSAGQKLVLLMLANYTNGHTGQCNPSQKRLADECSMGVSTLRNHINALEEAGFLEIIHKQEDGVSLPNQYRLKLEGVPQNLAGGPSESEGGVPQILRGGPSESGDKPGIEPGIETRKVTKYNARDALVDLDVSEQVIDDWLTQRTRMKAAVTQTALDGIVREANKAGITLDEALRVCCERGWRGFKADWYHTGPDRRYEDRRTRHERLSDHVAELTGRSTKRPEPEDDPRVIHGTAVRVD